MSPMRAAAATPRAATCSQCSARREAAPTASVLKTPLPEVALASVDFTSFSFVWHCFSFNAKFSIVEDVELSYQLFSDTKKAHRLSEPYYNIGLCEIRFFNLSVSTLLNIHL